MLGNFIGRLKNSIKKNSLVVLCIFGHRVSFEGFRILKYIKLDAWSSVSCKQPILFIKRTISVMILNVPLKGNLTSISQFSFKKKSFTYFITRAQKHREKEKGSNIHTYHVNIKSIRQIVILSRK